MHQPEEFIMGNAETRFSKNWLRATMMGVSLLRMYTLYVICVCVLNVCAYMLTGTQTDYCQ